MLRYIFFKLSGFTGKKEFSLSSSCNHMLTFCPTSTVKKDVRRSRTKNEPRLQQRRSYSFPSSSTRRTFSRNGSRTHAKTKPCIPGCQGLGVAQKTSYHKNIDKDSKSSKPAHSQAFSSSSKKHQTEKSDSKSKYQEMSTFNDSERYELESARPRRSQSELVFNVFDYVARDVDLTDYLQPNNLRPFGSNDNHFLPLLMSPKNLSISQDDPHYLQSITDVDKDHDNSNVEKEEIQEVKVKKIKPYKEIIRKHKELTSSTKNGTQKKNFVAQKLSRTNLRSAISKSLEAEEGTSESKNEMECHQCRKLPWTKASIKIEPPPFLSKHEEKFSSVSFSDMTMGTKRSLAIYRRIQPPWPAYSDHIKKNKVDDSPTPTLQHSDDVTDRPQSARGKLSLSQTRNMSTDQKVLDDKPKAIRKEEAIKNNLPQRRTMSLQHINTGVELSPSTENIPKTTKSSVFISKAFNKNPVTHSLISLRTKDVNLCPIQSYAKSSKYNKIRNFEPKPCRVPDNKKKCFLPSKVRLKPPKCITKPKDCYKPPPCIRADDCLEEPPKKLPPLKTNDCECFEPKIPNENPKMKKLNLKFFDEPRVCPCVPTECPCDPPPRADDFAKEKVKKLLPYIPAECACIEPPPMTDIPLIRLQKICEPEEKCYPKKPCPVKETCEDKIRADDCMVERIKKLPPLNIGDCRCIEPPVPDINPKLRRLHMEFVDPPRICPCEPLCECPEAPIRADDCAEEKVKKLLPIKPNDCPCIDPPRMVDVPLIRLKKVCEPSVCNPVKICPVETCEDKFRADMCLVDKPKKLPKFKPSNCECIEPHVPHEKPKLKRLKMKFEDEPRVCPCVPAECPCDPPIRADTLTKPKDKKLIPYIPKECQCIEPPPMTDVPLIRLQKVCEPEEKCYPKKPCPVEETCEDKIRADDCICEVPKKLRPIIPKPCPCIDFKMKDGPKLKRLDLTVPEPPRVCPPPKLCPPEECARADDCVPEKVKKLRKIKPGDCPCIEQPMVDVKPLPRLKCREDPEECLPADPCTDFPRADWGCWEYLQDVEEVDKSYKGKKTKDVSYKQKRKFNTDSRVSIQSRMNQGNNSSNQNITKYFSSTMKTTIRDRCIGPQPNKKTSTLPRDLRVDNMRPPRSSRVTKEEKNTKTRPVDSGLSRNRSLPTIFLLKELGQMTTNGGITKPKQPTSVKLVPPPNHPNSILTNSNVRKLSTVVLGTKKTSSCCPGMAQASSKSKKDGKEDTKKGGDTNKKTCPKMTKCFGPVILKQCPQKVERGCKMERTPVCCEKKTVPNPAFSECMEEEIQPYSNTSQWTCGRKEYGFEPNPKKPYEPLDTVKEKKKFSTSSMRNAKCTTGNAEHPIVNYFAAKYSKTEVVGQQRRGNVLDRISNSGVSTNHSKRDSSTFCDTKSDVTGVVRKDCNLNEDKYPKLLNLKSNNTVVGISCRKTLTQIKGRSTLLLNTSGLQCSRSNVDTITKRNLSSFNIASTSEVRGKELFAITRRGYSNDQSDDNNKRCSSPETKKTCPKFETSNCPEKAERSCKPIPQEVVCRKKPLAPYPSFSELMDNDMEERLTECPMEKEKIQQLQPHYPIPYHKPEIFTMEGVQQGRIDPKIEENCIRERLCLENQGITQNCENFGQYVKPLKSKKFFKDRNKDCERIAELKRMGKWPPKNHRRFSTSISKISVKSKCTKTFLHFTKKCCNYHSKLKSASLNTKNLSTCSVKVPVDNADIFTQRGISTSMTLSKNNKHKLIRFPLYPKPSKKCPKFKMPKCSEPVKAKQQAKHLQPRYPSLPEVDTTSIPPYNSKKESNWDEECLISFSGKEKKGKTWDCSSVERPFIRLNSSSLEPVNSKIPNEGERDNMPCIPCGEVFIHRIHMKAKGCLKNEPDNRLKCPKFPLPHPCKLGEKEPRKPYSLESYEPVDRSPRMSRSSTNLSLWQRIVNYFKARPNCPSPEEWKKKALREKAEKAARAAGLYLCEHKDLPKEATKRAGSKGSKMENDPRCFPARKNPCKVSTRSYSSGFNWEASEELTKLVEEEKKKQLTKESVHVLKDDLSFDDDANQKCPDPLFESMIKETIFNRNSLSCLEKCFEEEPCDKSVTYSLQLQESDVNFLEECVKEEIEENSSEQLGKVSDLQDYFSRIDTQSDICYEELENMKTKSLVQELNKLLKENQKPPKKN